MARRSGAGGAALAILLLASTLAVLSRPAAALSDLDLITQNTTGIGDMLSYDYHAVTCPRLVPIVRKLVHAAVQADASITPGLLRIHFHDCFPNGCDASILLDGPKSERKALANSNLNAKALRLIENIRRSVHRVCGATVSCTDITALATAEAIAKSGGPPSRVLLGRKDSRAPASENDVLTLPSPSTGNVNTLLRSFCKKGMCEIADLVALSGAHTVGSAHCPTFQDRRKDDAFGRKLQMKCRRNPNSVQILDAFTPKRFDNGYFRAVANGKGVLTSDNALIRYTGTGPLVRKFARDQAAFFRQFSKSMEKLRNVPKPKGQVGEIRRISCFRTNSGLYDDNIVGVTATADDEGFASVDDEWSAAVDDSTAAADEDWSAGVDDDFTPTDDEEWSAGVDDVTGAAVSA